MLTDLINYSEKKILSTLKFLIDMITLCIGSTALTIDNNVFLFMLQQATEQTELLKRKIEMDNL